MQISVLKHLFLSLLLCKCLLSVVAINGEGNGKPTKLTEMNVDVLFITLNYLDTFDLLRVSQTNAKFHSVAAAVFRHKYHYVKMSAEMSQGYHFKAKQEDDKVHIDNENKHLTIFDFEHGIELLKRFGKSMKKIEISRFISHYDANMVEICRNVNEYASEITYLRLEVINEILLSNFTAPFVQLEELECSFLEERRTTPRMVNELFPNLKKLTVSLLGNVAPSFFVANFPHLETVKYINKLILSSTTSHQLNISKVEDFLEKNPQIRSIDYQHFPDSFIKVVHKHLPKLERICLSSLDLVNETLHFESVKDLTLTSMHRNSIEKILFSHLESFTYNNWRQSTPEYFDSFRRFFEMNRSLKRLHLSINFIERNLFEQLEALLADLSNLAEVTLKFYYYVEADVIIRFIRNHKNLTKFEFIIWNSTEEDMDVIRKKLEGEWCLRDSSKYSNENWKGLTMERDNSMLLK